MESEIKIQFMIFYYGRRITKDFNRKTSIMFHTKAKSKVYTSVIKDSNRIT